jgi:hypothetical protein
MTSSIDDFKYGSTVVWEIMHVRRAYIHGLQPYQEYGITGVWIIIENTVVLCNPWWDRRVKH